MSPDLKATFSAILRRSLDSLQSSDASFRQMVETAQEGIWIVDRDGRTTYVNRQMAQLLGYGEDELIVVDGGRLRTLW